MSKINWCQTVGWSTEQLEDLRNASYAYIRQGKYEIARNFFHALTLLDPESAYDFQTLGALYLETKDGANAIRYLERALQLDADHTPTLLNLCKAFFMMGKVNEGLKLAAILQHDENLAIASTAKAFILAWS